MINPYAILAAVLFYLASLAGAGYVGWDYRDAKVAQQIKEATDDALQKASKQATADLAAAMARTEADATARERARKAKAAGVRDAIDSASTACIRSDLSVGLLNSAVDAANTATAASGMSLKVPATAQAAGR